MKKAGAFLTGGSAVVAGHSNFKKNVAPSTVNRVPLMGLQFIGAMWAMLGIGISRPARYPEDQPRYQRGKRPAQRPTRRTNMNHISKRVRRKHRRAS